ncbi:MAG: alkaline phosphatase family protein [Gemmatimonadaceae bacterium]|nr:alkaline phosphatase family protein [Chitinophagaceae bacterium]
MRIPALILVLAAFAFSGFGQSNAKKNPPKTTTGVQRPKLVVGIVIDQMRWDYLYRFNNRFAANGGFKKMLNQGFSCENTFIPYTPTITACGHTCLYTGSVPGIHGITGNAWWDKQLGRSVYCTEDKTVKSVGTDNNLGEMSPRNMLTTTICDELRLATNFEGKVIGVAVKDRGGILPAGHSANAAYWYDNRTGNWITSTYYMNELPDWVKKFNARKLVDSFYQKDWTTLYPIESYKQSQADQQVYEGKPFGADQKGFPYNLKKYTGVNYAAIATTPFGNSLTIEMAKAAIEAEKLGADSVTDFLALSISSTDYIGHAFGPNSIEQEDDFLRLDLELGALFEHLDKNVGKGQYTVFLSADHAVAHVPGFSKEHKLPGGTINDDQWVKDMAKPLEERFGHGNLIVSTYNYQVHLNHKRIDSLKVSKKDVQDFIVDWLEKQPAISRVFAIDRMMEVPLNAKIRQMFANGYYPNRGGDIQFVLQPGYIDGGATGTTHGAWNPYDSHIPLLWYGWGIKQGSTNREVYMTDVASTLAALLHIQMPSGAVGTVIEEAISVQSRF